MTNENDHLLHLFQQLLHHPEFMAALRQNHYSHGQSAHRGPGRVLHLIAQHDGVTNREIAEILDIRPSSVTALVNKLVEHDLITKESLEQDKRVTILKLTTHGQQVIDQTQKANNSLSQQLFAGLTLTEQQQLSTLLQKLLDKMPEFNWDEEPYATMRHYCMPRHHTSRHYRDWGAYRPYW